MTKKFHPRSNYTANQGESKPIWNQKGPVEDGETQTGDEDFGELTHQTKRELIMVAEGFEPPTERI